MTTVEVHVIRPRLGAYLGAEIALIAVLGSGWETTIYEFTIGARSSRMPNLPIHSPLVLRLYDGARPEDKAAREGATLSWLAAAKYPVPRPYVREQSRDALGAPFIIMDRVAGGPLFSATSFPLAFKTFSLGFIAFVRAQVRLHRIDLSRIRTNPHALYRRTIRTIQRRRDPRRPIARHARRDVPLPHDASRSTAPLAATPCRAPIHVRRSRRRRRCSSGCSALSPSASRAGRCRASRTRWRACATAPPATRAPSLPATPSATATAPDDSIVHLDYHPQNVIVRGIRVTGVIDWVSADRGDRHLDAATTSAILATSAMDRPRWMRDNRVGNSLRALFAALYFPAYHALAPMDLERFRYCQAVAALFRLSTFGMMRTRGPASVGFRPEAIANVTPDVVRLLTRYASRKSTLPVSLDPPP